MADSGCSCTCRQLTPVSLVHATSDRMAALAPSAATDLLHAVAHPGDADYACICLSEPLHAAPQGGNSTAPTAGATHTRFDHSLGVAFKAWEIADQIWRTQHAELGVERVDCKIVELAGDSSQQIGLD